MLTHNNNLNTVNNSGGFSLIELMFALLIGLVITGGVFSLYSSTRDTQRSSQEQLQLVADARFALNAIAYDIRHAGSWGTNNKWRDIYCHKDDARCSTALTTAVGDCGTRWYIDLEYSIVGSDDANPYGSTCATVDYKANTDVLGVKYADSTPLTTAQLAANVAYIRSNIQVGQIFIGTAWPDLGFDLYKFDDNAANNQVTRNHRLVARAYYVSNWTDVPGDGWPSLRRVDLGPGPQMNSAVLVPGVQDMQLEFGVDTNTKADGIINTYVSAGNIPKDSNGNPNWNRVHSVKVWLLMRSQRADREGISATQKFTIAGKPEESFDTGHHRMLVSQVIYRRN